jgi:uncharacterized protein YceK
VWKNSRIGRRIAAAVLATLLCGCQTSRSFEHGCPGVYSGVRYFNSQVAGLPPDGKIFFGLDLPFSAIFDTLLLPATFFVEPKRPVGGWVEGCKWVGR